MSDRRLVYSTESGRLDGGSGAKKARGRKKSPRSSAPPSGQGVRIRRETKGRGGKTVCVIHGLPLSPDERKALLGRLKRKLGCGGAMRGEALEIQGDHREALLALLEAEGYRAKLAGG